MKKVGSRSDGKYHVKGVKIATSKRGERVETLLIDGAYFGGIPLSLAAAIVAAYKSNPDVKRTIDGGNAAFIASMAEGESALFE